MNYTTKVPPVNNPSINAGQDDAQKTAQDVKSSFADIKDNVAKTTRSLSSKVHKLFDTASDEFTHATDTVTKEIRSNPVQSTVIALGVGYVLGRLLKR